MRHLLQPRVLTSASLAALISAAMCYPRLAVWSNQAIPVWLLEAIIFGCATVLWGFVLAWHKPYSGRPVFWVEGNAKIFLLATLAGTVFALICRLWLDPPLKTILPKEFPVSPNQWFASVLFLLGFSQLFLTFATFDWLLRLCRRPRVAMVLTAVLGVSVVAMKIHSQSTPLSAGMLTFILVGRFIGGLLTVVFYLRGGMLAAWWWAFLLEARHLLDWA